MPFVRVHVSGLWQYRQRNMQAVVQATRRMPGPSTAEPVVKECRKPRSPVLSALLTSVSAMPLPRCTRISNGDLASSGTVRGGGAAAISISFAVECAVDHIHLLLASETDKIDCIAGHADRETGIILRMVHCVEQGLAVQDVDIHVIAGHPEEPVENCREVRDPIVLAVPEAA